MSRLHTACSFIIKNSDLVWFSSFSHGFRYSQIDFRPHSYVEINPIWIGYVHLRLPCKWSDRILPCKCDSYVIEMCVFVTFRGTDIPVTWNISSWVAEYYFFPFVLNKRRSDAEMYCFWNHAECSLLLSVMTAHAQTSASVPFVPLKPQNKMHTNMSLPLIYNHWWTHSVLITKKTEYVTISTTYCSTYYSEYYST